MTRTEYSWMTSEELILFVLGNEASTTLSIELAQRLDFYLNEFKKEAACPPQKDESKTQ